MVNFLKSTTGTLVLIYVLLTLLTLLLGDVWTIRVMGLVFVLGWAWNRWPNRLLGFITAGRSNRNVVDARTTVNPVTVEEDIYVAGQTAPPRRFWNSGK